MVGLQLAQEHAGLVEELGEGLEVEDVLPCGEEGKLHDLCGAYLRIL